MLDKYNTNTAAGFISAQERKEENNMKKLYRIGALAMSLIIAASVCGCGTKNDGSKGGKTDSNSSGGGVHAEKAGLFDERKPDESKDPLKKGIDLDGYEFVIMDFNESPWTRTSNGSKADNARVEMLKKIEDELNCTITYKYSPYSKYFSTYQTSIMSGKKVADVLTPTMYEVGAFINAGLAVDVNKIPNLNLNNEYWNHALVDMTAVNGKSYMLNCDIYPHWLGTLNINFNKNIIKELGLESPYELVKKGEWTIDKYIEYAKAAKKDLDGVAGFGNKDRYGIAGTGWGTSYIFHGSGIPVLKYDNDLKKVVFNFKPTKTSPVNEQAINVINKLKDIGINGENLTPTLDTDDYTTQQKYFANGQALFFCTMTRTIFLEMSDFLRNMKDDWGILPLPNLGGKEYNCLVDNNMATMIVPISNKDLDKTGTILDAIAYHSYYDYEPLFAQWLADTYFRDDESYEMLELIYQNMYYDIFMAVGTSDKRLWDIESEIIVGSATNKGYDPAQAIAKLEDSIRTAVDEFYGK